MALDYFYVKITDEMKNFAENEVNKRRKHINHHFKNPNMDQNQSDKIGFIGEFCACALLGIDWKSNIRTSYKTIDSGDGICSKGVFDVKTEVLPRNYLRKVISRAINDDELYGRRLINIGQGPLLKKYEIVIFGALIKNSFDKWYPLGWIETDFILKEYNPTNKRPDGGLYPFAAYPIRTSQLCSIDLLIKQD